MTERLELVVLEIPDLGERRVQNGGGMALREHEAIALRILGILGVVAHHAGEKERCHDVRRRKRPARMSGARRLEHLYDIAPHPVGDEGNLRVVVCASASQLFCCHVRPFKEKSP